jgi:hypothetical protein
MRRYIISDQGEILGEIHPGDRLVRKKSLEVYKKGIKLPDVTCEFVVSDFFKGNAKEINLIIPELNKSERSFLFSIASYVSYIDCCLQFKNGKCLRMLDIQNLTKLGRTELYTTVSSLIKKDILYKGKNSTDIQYFVNPWIFSKGQKINKVLKKMFGNYKVRSRNNVMWKDMHF